MPLVCKKHRLAQTPTHARTHVRTNTHTHIHPHPHTHTYPHTHTHKHTHKHAHTQRDRETERERERITYAHAHAHAHTHTHTHTETQQILPQALRHTHVLIIITFNGLTVGVANSLDTPRFVEAVGQVVVGVVRAAAEFATA